MTTASATALTRIILVGERSPQTVGREAPAIRRYRLARLQLNDRAGVVGGRDSSRFSHLRHSYD
jgi:hypothetical protein